jgi:selT/selW/selH-like putative selenoprotein
MPQALRVRARLEELGAKEFDLQPGKSGQFDVTVNGELAFSRHKVGRFPTDDEIEDLIKA